MSRKWVESKVGRLFGHGLEAGIHETSRYVGLEHVDEANEKLAEGDSLLVIGNHPNSETAVVVVGATARRLYAGGEKAVLASSKFWGIGGDMGWKGDMSRMMMMQKWGIEPLMVAQESNVNIDDEVRSRINMATVRRTLSILKSPRGVVWMYQEGTRCPAGLGVAQEGIGRFISKADWVLQAVAEYGRWRPGKGVEFLPPFPAAVAVSVVAEQFEVEEKSASGMVADYLVVRLARRLPERRRGVYGKAVEVAEGRGTDPRWVHLPAMFWLLGE